MPLPCDHIHLVPQYPLETSTFDYIKISRRFKWRLFRIFKFYKEMDKTSKAISSQPGCTVFWMWTWNVLPVHAVDVAPVVEPLPSVGRHAQRKTKTSPDNSTLHTVLTTQLLHNYCDRCNSCGDLKIKRPPFRGRPSNITFSFLSDWN